MSEYKFGNVFYFCNGQNPACGHCEGCYVHGGDCRQTTNVDYAITPICNDPWNHPERFEPVSYSGCNTYYFERFDRKDKVEDVYEGFEDGENED